MAKILVTEDDPAARKFVVDVIGGMGHEVVECRDGERAIAILRNEEDIDLLLTDILMPKMNGINLVHFVRKMHEFDTLPIIVMSGVMEVLDSYPPIVRPPDRGLPH